MPNLRIINRRTFILAGLIGGSAATATYLLSQPKSGIFSGQRNVLLLISDDHGLDQLGCYGNAKIKTPNIDAMATNGVRFSNAFAATSSCSPSRGTIFTGLYPYQNGQYGLQHGRNNFSLRPWVQTLPELLKKKNFQTGIIGKLHVGPETKFPFDLIVPFSEIMTGRDVKKMAQKAGDFFNQEPNKPFFLAIGYYDPHRAGEGFGNEQRYPGIKPTIYDQADLAVPPFLPDIPEVREELADMYQSVTRMDTGIGMVLDKLKKSGRYDDTLIIYLTDNGIPFVGAKTNVYDSGVHLPLIVCSPTIEKKGIVNNAMVSFIDLVPTILEWTGISNPDYELPGKSLLSILNAENPQEWEEVYHTQTFHEVTMYYPMRSIRTRQFKYIINLAPDLEFPLSGDIFRSKTWEAVIQRKLTNIGKRTLQNYLYRPSEELYNLETDPDEINNLVGNSKFTGILNELRNKLQSMREKTNDPWLVWQNRQLGKGDR